MNELHLQDKFLVPFFRDALGYQEVKANTVSNSLIIEEDLEAFISETELNKKSYEALLRKYSGDRQKLLADVIALIQERIASSRNMALFLNANKSITLHGIKLHLFTPATASFTTILSSTKTSFRWCRNCPTNTIFKADRYFPSAPICVSL